jgi:hypothetical protein
MVNLLEEKGNRSFSSWTTIQNITATIINLKYVEIVVGQYYLVMMILKLMIPPIKIKIVGVILDTLTNIPMNLHSNQMKPENIWLDPATSKP